MAGIEIWRLRELATSLHDYAGRLQEFDEPEWARVFFHFEAECRAIVPHSPNGRIQLRTLLANIRTCFSDSASLRDLSLRAGLMGENREVLHELMSAQTDLLKLLEELDRATVEIIH